jgi:16S rRNA processing protein RimM
MESVEKIEMVILGRVTGSYSLHGWVKVHLFGDDAAALGDMPQWWLAADAENGPWAAYALHQFKPHGKSLIAKFDQVADRNASEAIDGFYIAAPRSALPKTAGNEYYWADLKGLTVRNIQGDVLGQITDLMTSGAHDVLCVRDAAGQERLLPFVGHVVKQVDAENREVRVEWGVDW